MRKLNSIKNFITNFLPFVLITLLGFYKLRVFKYVLGDEIYALNQVFFQIFAYLSMAEAGVGAIVQKEYYKLFAEKDQASICKYYALSKYKLKKITGIMLGLGVVISFFLKLLTKGNSLPLWYMQLVFVLFLVKNCVDYLMFSPRFVLQADQKIYKINILYNMFRVIETVVEILCIFAGFDFLLILLVGIFVRYIMNWCINRRVFKEYPWLKEDKAFEDLQLSGMGSALLHKLTGAVHDNTDALILSTFVSPITTIIYTNYNYIVKTLNDCIYTFTSSILASLGNAMYAEDNEHRFLVFRKVNYIYLFISSAVCCILFTAMNSFIEIWMGKDSLIDYGAFILLLLCTFHNIARKPLYMLRDVFAMFKETQVNVIAEMIINLVLSLILVGPYKIAGILFATLISMLLTNFWYFPLLFYKQKFKKNVFLYFYDYLLSMIVSVVICIASNYFIGVIHFSNFIYWGVFCLFYACIVGVILVIANTILFKEFRMLLKDVLSMVKNVLEGIRK